jgi:hypothetical protein
VRHDDYNNKKYAIVEKEPEEKVATKWFGVYRGIRYEINRFAGFQHNSQKFSWTHYILLTLDQVSEEHREKFWLTPEYSKAWEGGIERLSYSYYDSIIAQVEFHGGCTWYSKESGPDEKTRVVKFGCDYQHLWDEGQDYSLSYVVAEAKKSIDSLLSIVGEVRVHTWGDGKLRLLSEMSDDAPQPEEKKERTE